MSYSLKNYIKTYFQVFFTSKKGLFLLLSFTVFYGLSTIIQTFIDIGYSDEKKIILGVSDGVLAILFQVFFYNFYFTSISAQKFSFQKTLWDVPKYLFTSLILTLSLVSSSALIYFLLYSFSSIVATIVCGLYIVFFLLVFIYLPMISILFDHYQSDLSLTKKLLGLIRNNFFFYLSLIFFVFIVTIIELSLSELILGFSISNYAKLGIILLMALFSLFSTSLIIHFFKDSSQEDL